MADSKDLREETIDGNCEGPDSVMADSKDLKEETIAGNCEGPDSVYVKLIASDGLEFVIKREHANLSKTIQGILNPENPLAARDTNTVTLSLISSPVLAIVCRYLAYKARYKGTGLKLPNFFEASEEPDLATCLDMLIAADFLDC